MHFAWSSGCDLCFSGSFNETVGDAVHMLGVPIDAFYVLVEGRLASVSEQLQNGSTYRVVPRVLGGKGGFGSMLRAIGAQIEKTTSREACRDLSGRRVRDVNNEKKLKEWVGKQAEREREKEERRRLRREKRERLLAESQPKLEDPTYHEQYAKAQESLQAALQAGLQKVKERERKRKGDSSDGGPPVKRLDLLGMGINPDDLDTDSDSDSTESSSGASASAGPSTSGDKPRNSKATATVTSAALQGSEDNSDSCSSSSYGFVVTEQAACVKGRNERTDSSSMDSAELKNEVKQENGATTTVKPKKENGETAVTNNTDSDNSGLVAQATPVKDKVDKNGGDSASKEGNTDAMEGSGSVKPPQKNSLLSLLPPPVNSSSGKASKSSEDFEPVVLEQYSSAEELEHLGLEHLKVELTRHGLKCGGTLEERAERLFSIKGLSPNQINPKLLAKLAKGKGQGKK